MIITNVIERENIAAWHLQPVILMVKDILSQVENLKVSHICREGNMAVDGLSKWALPLEQEVKFKFEYLRTTMLTVQICKQYYKL